MRPTRRRHGDTRGAAMIIVMCIMCVFVVISFALLLSTSLLASSAVKMMAREQSRIYAVTFSQTLGGYVTGDAAEGENAKNNDLCANIRSTIGEALESPNKGWKYYNDSESGHDKLDKDTGTLKELVLTFDDDTKQKIGDITASMYWECDEDSVADYMESVASALEANDNPETAAKADPTLSCELVVTVKCVYNNETYIITNRYALKSTITADVTEADNIKWEWYLTWQGE